jgi:hypothetical protein
VFFVYFRFRTDHTAKAIPLSDVAETKESNLEGGGIEAELEDFYTNLFLIQDLYASGYRMADVEPNENGLVISNYLCNSYIAALIMYLRCYQKLVLHRDKKH